jgi:UrcA family protein
MIVDTATVTRATFGTLGTLLFAGICLAGATVPARANELGSSARTEVVRTGDLNLASPAGRDTLAGRIQAAAERVCAARPSDIAARMEQNRCLREAVGAANSRLTVASASAR